MEEHKQGELNSYLKVNEADRIMVSEKQRKNNVLQIAVRMREENSKWIGGLRLSS